MNIRSVIECLFPSLRDRRKDLEHRTSLSHKLSEAADHRVNLAENIFHQQTEVSQALAEERRKNHFAELMLYGVPVKKKPDPSEED